MQKYRHALPVPKTTRSSATVDGPRDALSFKILSTVDTSCTTNPQEVAVIELEGYSWSTCNKQPRLIDCRIGVVNKLDRRRRRRILLTTWSTYCGEIFKVQSLGQSPRGKYPKFFSDTIGFDTTPACDRQTDEQTHDSIYRSSIASRGKTRWRNWRGFLKFDPLQYRCHRGLLDIHWSTMWVKKQDTKLLPITSPNILPIFKLFSVTDSVVNLQQILFKYSTTP